MSTTLATLLQPAFDGQYVAAIVEHYGNVVDEFQRSEWEDAIQAAGKLVEAILKALQKSCGLTPATGKDFKVDHAIRDLEQVPKSKVADNVRTTIPRACRFIYEVASNRGARHDPSDISPNEMDATAVQAQSAWIVAELVRISQLGAVTTADAVNMVSSLSERKLRMVETIDGKTYFHYPGISAREVGLLTLAISPARIHRDALLRAIVRHSHNGRRYSNSAARTAISRLAPVLDDDGKGMLRLLQPGIQEAERIMRQAAAAQRARTRPGLRK